MLKQEAPSSDEIEVVDLVWKGLRHVPDVVESVFRPQY